MNVAEPSRARQGTLAERHNQIPSGVSNELVRTLAVLRDADERDAQALIASLPYGSRATLSAYGLIERIVPSPGAVSPIAITEAGRQAIAAAAEVYSPSEADEARWTAELQAADAAYRAGRLPLPDDPRAVLKRMKEMMQSRGGGSQAQM